MIIEYNRQNVFMNSIDVVDAGNMCICGHGVNLDKYYMLTKSIAGKVHILKIGPVLDTDACEAGDTNVLLEDFEISYKKIKYNEKSLAKEISGYINDPHKGIVEVEETINEEAYRSLPQIAVAFDELN